MENSKVYLIPPLPPPSSFIIFLQHPIEEQKQISAVNELGIVWKHCPSVIDRVLESEQKLSMKLQQP